MRQDNSTPATCAAALRRSREAAGVGMLKGLPAGGGCGKLGSGGESDHVVGP